MSVYYETKAPQNVTPSYAWHNLDGSASTSSTTSSLWKPTKGTKAHPTKKESASRTKHRQHSGKPSPSCKQPKGQDFIPGRKRSVVKTEKSARKSTARTRSGSRR